MRFFVILDFYTVKAHKKVKKTILRGSERITLFVESMPTFFNLFHYSFYKSKGVPQLYFARKKIDLKLRKAR